MGMGISGTDWRLNKPGCPKQDAAIVESGKKTEIIHLKQRPAEKCEASVLRAGELGCYVTR
ncbi:MAG TPA: hypothetical protein VFV82_02170, partial [Candidatus Binatia bacterium]|nr:hypothetical protein [Candidatus Binatia bacterium]